MKASNIIISIILLLCLTGCIKEEPEPTIDNYKIIKTSRYSFRGISHYEIYVTKENGVFENKCFSVDEKGYNPKFFKEGNTLKLKSDMFKHGC